MIDVVRQYIYSVMIVSILCSILRKLYNPKSASGTAITLLTSIFLLVTIVSPLIKLDQMDFGSLKEDITSSGQYASEIGVTAADESMSEIITEKTTAYILEKAAILDAQIQVDVILDNNSIPTGVKIDGTISPYDKQVLSDYISSTLAIPEEKQVWN